MFGIWLEFSITSLLYISAIDSIYSLSHGWFISLNWSLRTSLWLLICYRCDMVEYNMRPGSMRKYAHKRVRKWAKTRLRRPSFVSSLRLLTSDRVNYNNLPLGLRKCQKLRPIFVNVLPPLKVLIYINIYVHYKLSQTHFSN